MPGLICGFYGYQRSGKTLLAYLFAEKYYNMGIPVYTNMDVPGYTKIEKITDLPFNFEPKVLLLDEAYFFLDSRSWSDNTAASIFFNTIGKQNVLLLMTAIDPSTIEVRVRRQHNYLFLVKSDKQNIYYNCINVQRNTNRMFNLEKNDDLFKKCRYDTRQVPDYVDFALEDFAERVKKWNAELKSKNDSKNIIKNKRSVVL